MAQQEKNTCYQFANKMREARRQFLARWNNHHQQYTQPSHYPTRYPPQPNYGQNTVNGVPPPPPYQNNFNQSQAQGDHSQNHRQGKSGGRRNTNNNAGQGGGGRGNGPGGRGNGER